MNNPRTVQNIEILEANNFWHNSLKSRFGICGIKHFFLLPFGFHSSNIQNGTRLEEGVLLQFLLFQCPQSYFSNINSNYPIDFCTEDHTPPQVYEKSIIHQNLCNKTIHLSSTTLCHTASAAALSIIQCTRLPTTLTVIIIIYKKHLKHSKIFLKIKAIFSTGC